MSGNPDKKSLVFPSIESMIGSSFVTITLRPEFYNRRAGAQYGMLSKAVAKMVKRHTDKCIMCPELTKKGNIHMHLILRWSSRVEYAEERMIDEIKTHKIIGSAYVTPNKIQNSERAITAFKYMLEDYKKTRCILRLPEILYEWQYEIPIVDKKNETIDYLDYDKIALKIYYDT